MSESRRVARSWALPVAIALASAVIVPRMSAAQSTAQYRARLIASLHDRRVIRDSLDALHAHRVMEVPPDSMNSAPLHVRFDRATLGPDLEATLRGAVRRAAGEVDTEFGDAQIGDSGAVLVVSRVRFGLVTALGFDAVLVELSGGRGRMSPVRSPITERKLADALVDMIGTLATDGVPANVSKWAGYHTPARPLTHDDWEAAALDLATSSSSVARTCYGGSVAGCESALGLTTVRDSLAEWYTPEGWRARVDSWNARPGDVELADARAECVEKKVMATCERLARSRPIPVPLDMATRSTLFNLAIARGGRSAYAKLRSAHGTPLEVLSAVAGIAPDALVDDWRTHTLAAVPHGVRPGAAEATVLLAWTALFGFAATRRRS